MNVQFGNIITPNVTPTQATENRNSVAAPVDAEEQSSTSFTTVEEVEETQKTGRQESDRQGIESREALNERRQERLSDREAALNERDQRREDANLKEAQAEKAIAEDRAAERAEQRQLEADRQLVRELADRDREVRNHEQAHQSVGGEYAGAATFTYQRGPDGQNYAVGGEVSIDASRVSNDPAATVTKAETIRRAALAPAEPSAQDRRVAAQASQMALEAQAELQQLKREELQVKESETVEDADNKAVSEEERLDRAKEAQKEAQEESKDLEESVASDLQKFNERLVRIQAQLEEISQFDEKAKASTNLLDATI